MLCKGPQGPAGENRRVGRLAARVPAYAPSELAAQVPAKSRSVVQTSASRLQASASTCASLIDPFWLAGASRSARSLLAAEASTARRQERQSSHRRRRDVQLDARLFLQIADDAEQIARLRIAAWPSMRIRLSAACIRLAQLLKAHRRLNVVAGSPSRYQHRRPASCRCLRAATLRRRRDLRPPALHSSLKSRVTAIARLRSSRRRPAPPLVVRPQLLRSLDIAPLALLGAAVSRMTSASPSRPK